LSRTVRQAPVTVWQILGGTSSTGKKNFTIRILVSYCEMAVRDGIIKWDDARMAVPPKKRALNSIHQKASYPSGRNKTVFKSKKQ